MGQGGERGELKRRLARWWWPIAPMLVFAAWQTAVGRTYRGTAVIAIALVGMIATSFLIWPRTRWLRTAVIPLLVAAVFGIVSTGYDVPIAERLATTTAVAGTAMLVLWAFGVDPRRAVDGLIHGVGVGLRALAGGLVFVLLIVPAWLWTRIRRRDPLRPGQGGAGWMPARQHAGPPGSLAAGGEPPLRRRTLTGRLAWAVGCIVLVLAANYGIGWTWDQAFPTSEEAASLPGEVAQPTGIEGEATVEQDPDLWPLIRAEYQEHSAIEKVIDFFEGQDDAGADQTPPGTIATTMEERFDQHD